MTCVISEENKDRLGGLILRRLRSGNPLDLDNFLKDFYKKNIVRPGWDNDRIITYIQLIPSIIKKILSRDIKLTEDLTDKGLSLDYLNTLDKSFKNDIENVNSFLREANILQDMVDNINLTRQVELGRSFNSEVNNVGEPKAFQEWPVHANATTGSEIDRDGNPYPEKITRYTFQRNLIRSILTNNKIPDYYGSMLRLSAVHSSKVEGYTGPNKVLFAITDTEGNILSLNLEGKPEGAREIMYYESREVTKKGTVYSSVSPLAEISAIRRESARQGLMISKKQAETIRQQQLKELYDLREYIIKNPEAKIITEITGGSFGYSGHDFGIKSPFAEIRENITLHNSFEGGPVEFEGFPKGGATYFKIPGIQEPILLQKKPVSSELAQRLAILLTEDVYQDTLLYTPALKLEVAERFMGSSAFWKLGKDDAGNLKLSLNDTIINLNDKENARKQITEFFDTYFPLQEVPESEVRSKFIDGDVEGWKDLLYQGAIVKSTRKGKTVYQKYTRPSFNIVDRFVKSPDFFREFELTQGNNGYNIENKKIDYYKWLGDKTFINYRLTDEGKIRSVNSYFNYKLTEGSLNKLYPLETTQQEKPDKKAKPRKKKELTDAEKAFIAKTLKKNKTHEEKEADVKATEQQIKDAKIWYNKHPMSRYLPFDQAFNIVNSDGVAQFTPSGLTLFKGSDYSDLYHEAWHGFSQMFMTPEEKINLYNEIGKRSGSFVTNKGTRVTFKNASYEQIEEYLAEDFRKYMLSAGDHIIKGSPVRNTIFRRILNFLKALFGDTTASQLMANSRSVNTVRDLFEKLRIGEINERSFSEDNAIFDVLHKGLVAIDKNNPIHELSQDDSTLIVNTIDSIFSTLAQKLNLQLEEYRKEKASLEESSSRTKEDDERLKFLKSLNLRQRTRYEFSTEEGRSDAYRTLYDKSNGTGIIPDRRKELFWKKTNKDFSDYTAEPSSKMSEAEIEHFDSLIQKDLDTLDYIINEFGNPDDPFGQKQKDENGYPIGVIAYHNRKSEFLSFEDKFITEDNNLPTAWNLNKGGNQVSTFDRGRSAVWYLVRGLHRVNPAFKSSDIRTILELRTKANISDEDQDRLDELTDKMYVKNRLGFPELGEFHSMRRRLTRLLAGTVSHTKMLDILKENQVKYPYLIQLIENLGDPNDADNGDIVNQWTDFWSTFNSARIPLPTHFLNKEENGEYSQRTGNAAGPAKSIQNFWNKSFEAGKTGNDQIVIKRANESPYIDLKAALNKYTLLNRKGYEEPGINVNNLVDFLYDVGVDIERNDDIRRDIFENKEEFGKFAKAMWYRLKDLGKYYNKPVTSLNILFNTILEVPLPGGGVKETAESKRYTQIAELQSKYSDMFSEMVSTPSGDSRSEYSLNSTMSVQVDYLNSARDYNELVQGPMSYLDQKHPWPKASKILASLFDMKTGQRRKGITLDLKSINGISVLNNNESIGLGSSAASADEFSKFIADIAFSLAGSPENLRAGEKSTSYSSSVIYHSPYSKGRMWMDPEHFIPGQEVLMMNKVYKSIIPYLISEHERVMIMRNAKEGSPELDKRWMKDGKYVGYAVTGKDFCVFEDLDQKLKDDLYNIDNLSEFLKQDTKAARVLQSRIKENFNKWWNKLFTDVETDFYRRGFIADNVLRDLVRPGKNYHNPLTVFSNFTRNAQQRTELVRTVLRAYEFNTWIHNMEVSMLFYGDHAEYTKAVEFHKRISMASSTGDIFRTDDTMMNYINNGGMRYAESLGITPKKFTRVLGSAVMADPEITSHYYNEIYDALYSDLVSRGIKESKAKRVATKQAEAYVNMKVADAQGWITFDSYRALSKASGAWTEFQEGLYNQIVKGSHISPEMVLQYFPVRKYQYLGPMEVEGLPVTAAHKYSLMPLIPSFTDENPVLKSLHERMMRDGVDYATLLSGSKITTITNQGELDKFYTDDKTSFDTKPFTINRVYLDFLKNQQDVNNEYKKKVTIATQMRKIIEEGFMANGVPSDFPGKDNQDRIDKWNKLSEAERLAASDKYVLVRKYEHSVDTLTEAKMGEFIKSIGWDTPETYGTVTEKLSYMIDKELQRQDISDHERSYIQMTSVKGGLKFKDLSYNLSAEVIERVMASMINRELVKQKSRGESLVQVSSTGTESAKFMEMRQKLTPEEKLLYGTNDLPYYRPKGRTYMDGKKKRVVTSAAKCKVSFMPHFDPLLDLMHTDNLPIQTVERLNEMIKNEDWLNKGDHRRMITLVGPRTPVQEQNSMEFEEVWQFLPRSSGNIIIHPAEIVAKSGSDFDVDKVSMMIPNLKFDESLGRTILFRDYSDKELKVMYEQYKKFKIDVEKIKLEKQEDSETIYPLSEDYETIKLFNAIFGTRHQSIRDEILGILLEEKSINTPEDFKNRMNGTKMAENEYMYRSQQLLEHPDNYVNLVRPNGVYTIDPIINGEYNDKGELVKEGIRNYVSDYDPRIRYDGTSGKLSYSRLNERAYNHYIGQINKVSQDALAIAAVDNPANITFNRVGAKMNYSYNDNTRRGEDRGKPGITKVMTIHLPHNTVKDKNGKDVISLSHLLDAEGNERISGNISQMMNLLLEIAKNDSAYYAQLKREVIPTMLYLQQAGVPIDQLIYFASQPIIREYMEQIRLARSPVADALGAAPVDEEGNIQSNFFQNKARGVILEGRHFRNQDGTPMLNLYKHNPRTADRVVTRNEVQEIIPGGIRQVWDISQRLIGKSPNAFDKERMYKKIVNRDTKVDDQDRAVLLHWFELEDQAKAIRDVKIRMNFDTKRSMSAFLAIKKTQDIQNLTADGRLDPDMVNKILTDSAISSLYKVIGSTEFGKQGFLVDFLSALFPLRANNEIGAFLSDKISDMGNQQVISGTFGDLDKGVASFFSDLVSYIFQNKLRSFRISDAYRNINTDSNLKTKHLDFLPLGAVVKNGTLYYNRPQLTKDWQEKNFSKEEYRKRGLALLRNDQFQTAFEFYNYVFEREYLRDYYTVENVASDSRFIDLKMAAYKRAVSKGINQDQKLQDRLNKIAYEEFIRDRALENIGNHKQLFIGDTSYADQVMDVIKDARNTIAQDYPSLATLTISTATFGDRIRNLQVMDRDLSPDMVDSFHQNLVKLADPNVMKVPDVQENNRISELFSLFPLVAFLQSGLTSSGTFSMTRLVPAERILDFMKNATDEFTGRMNNKILNQFYDQWLIQNKRKSKSRGKQWVRKETDQFPEGTVVYTNAVPSTRTAPGTIRVEQISPEYAAYDPFGIDKAVALNTIDKTKGKRLVYVYNDAVNRNASPEKNSDGFFALTASPFTYGITTRATFNSRNGKPVQSLTDITYADNIKLIDVAINSLKEQKESGAILTFNKQGYGQQMLGLHSDGVTKIPSVKGRPGLKTFMYLSQRLFELGFVNPNYTKMEIPEVRPAEPVQKLYPEGAAITFSQETASGYAARTHKNASADATIALAVDFTSAGERATKSSVLSQKKKYISVDASSLNVSPERVSKIVKELNSAKPSDLGLTTNHAMSYKMTAENNLTGKDTSTLELAEQGLRTATTRSFPLGKVGDIITFEGKAQKYKITGVEKLTVDNTKDPIWIKQWAQKEYWTEKHFKEVLGGKTVHIGSYQTSFEKVADSDGISLNIAGNGIYTMAGKYTQQQVDDFTYKLLKAVIESPDLKVKITSIRTGGQTGFDEAGAKAGLRLGIPTSILAPKGWAFRIPKGERHEDVYDEVRFKERFNEPVVESVEEVLTPELQPPADILTRPVTDEEVLKAIRACIEA